MTSQHELKFWAHFTHLGASNGQKCEKAEACAESEQPIETEFTAPVFNERMAGVHQGDFHGQVLRNRILRSVCWRYSGICDGISFRNPEESGIAESYVSERRIFFALQGETMYEGTQGLASKMITNAEIGTRPASDA